MPIYEYKCEKCDNITEEITDDKEQNKSKCPICGNTSKRIMSAGSFIINGFNESNGYS